MSTLKSSTFTAIIFATLIALTSLRCTPPVTRIAYKLIERAIYAGAKHAIVSIWKGNAEAYSKSNTDKATKELFALINNYLKYSEEQNIAALSGCYANQVARYYERRNVNAAIIIADQKAYNSKVKDIEHDIDTETLHAVILPDNQLQISYTMTYSYYHLDEGENMSKKVRQTLVFDSNGKIVEEYNNIL
jgi:peroxiredoxin